MRLTKAFAPLLQERFGGKGRVVMVSCDQAVDFVARCTNSQRAFTDPKFGEKRLEDLLQTFLTMSADDLPEPYKGHTGNVATQFRVARAGAPTRQLRHVSLQRDGVLGCFERP